MMADTATNTPYAISPSGEPGGRQKGLAPRTALNSLHPVKRLGVSKVTIIRTDCCQPSKSAVARRM